MAKEIKFEADARAGMAEGVKKLADAVIAVTEAGADASVQEELLKADGIEVVNGRVDLKKYGI